MCNLLLSFAIFFFFWNDLGCGWILVFVNKSNDTYILFASGHRFSSNLFLQPWCIIHNLVVWALVEHEKRSSTKICDYHSKSMVC